MGTYDDVFQASVADPERFWLDAATLIDWTSPPRTALDASRPPFYRWFPDGELNVCHNALDRHVEAGRGEQPALIYDSPVTGTRRSYTYAELRDEVARFAGVLTELGVDAGRPGGDLHADGARGGGGHAGLRPDRRRALGGVRRVRAQGAGRPHRRRGAEGDRLGVLRHRGRPGDRVQAAAGPGHRAGHAQAGRPAVILQRPQAAAAHGPERRRLGRGDARRPTPVDCRADAGHRPALHPLHLGHHREAEGRGARRRRLRGGAGLDDAQRLRRRRRRDDVHRVRRRLGGRALLHRLRAAAGRGHDRALRGQAGRHPGRRAVLAGDLRVRR